MPNRYYLIRAQTLTAITNAISQVGLNADFPLLTVVVGKDLHYIYHQTLVDIANTIRQKAGTVGEIPVTNLAEKILALGNKPSGNTTAILGKAILGKAILGTSESLEKLATPVIRLEVTNGKLNTPVIHLETSEGTTEVDNTTAILGKAILGKAILGSSLSLEKLTTPTIYLEVVEDGGTPAITKLSAPTIYLEEIAEVLKLATPNIYLETIDDSEPEGPEIVKLNRPHIRIEVVSDEPEGPAVAKLSTPTIYLETIDDNEPEDPIMIKLDAPVIRLEVVDDSEPEEPVIVQLSAPNIYLEVIKEEPVEPEITKLDTPVIHLEEIIEVVKLSTPTIYLETIEEHRHSYTSVVTAPTCTEQGYTTHTCAECGDEYVDSVTEALGHAWGDPYYSNEFSTGYGCKCNRCSELEDLQKPLEKLATPVIRLEEVIPHLDAPQNVKYDEDTCILSWDAVEGATHYEVDTDTGFNPSKIQATEYDFALLFEQLYIPAGYTELTVTVIAQNEDMASEASEPVTIKVKAEKEKLVTPVIYTEII